MVETWATTSIVNQETRAAQNNFAMYKCLTDSISEDLKNAIVSKGANCTVDGTKIAALMFKAIMDESEINTVATVATIQLQLSRLNKSILNNEISGDIVKFNQYVKDKVRELTCRGATYSGLILNLLHAYKSVTDSDFIAFISTKETSYLHDELELTADKLMLVAEFDYTIRVEKGTWGQLPAEQQQIVALSADLNQFRKNKNNNGSNNKTKGGGDKSGNKKKNSKKNKSNKDKDSKWAWKKIPQYQDF